MELRKIWNNNFHKKPTLKKLADQAFIFYLLTSKPNLINFTDLYPLPETLKSFWVIIFAPKSREICSPNGNK